MASSSCLGAEEGEKSPELQRTRRRERLAFVLASAKQEFLFRNIWCTIFTMKVVKLEFSQRGSGSSIPGNIQD